MQQEIKNGDITLDDLAVMVKGGFDAVDHRLGSVEHRLGSVEHRLDKIEDEIVDMKSEMTSMKAVMVTKEYLDDKLADLRGDILTVIRKEDSRLSTLVAILNTKKVLNEEDVSLLQRLRPLVPIPNA